MLLLPLVASIGITNPHVALVKRYTTWKPTLYKQYSARIVAVNAPSLDFPAFHPRTDDGNDTTPTRTQRTAFMTNPIVYESSNAHYAFVLRPHLHQRILMHPDKNVDLVGAHPADPSITNVTDAYLQKITGPGSPVSEAWDKAGRYIRKLNSLGITLASYRHDELNLIRAFDSLRPFIHAQGGKYEVHCRSVDDLEDRYHLIQALVRLATHLALDAIAYLAGLEAPKFPPDENLIGALIYADPNTPRLPDGYPDDLRTLWHTVCLERMGVPMWGIIPTLQYQRLDFVKEGRPTKNDSDAQYSMREILHNRRPPTEDVVIYTEERRGLRPIQLHAVPTERLFTDELKDVIIRALDCEKPDAYTIGETNEKLKNLLGPEIWSGRRWQDGAHHDAPHRTWYGSRDILMNPGPHQGVHHAHFSVPAGYFHPEFRFPQKTARRLISLVLCFQTPC